MKKTLALAAALSVLWTASSWAAATIGLSNYDANNPIYLLTSGSLVPTAGTYVQLTTPQGAVTPTDSTSSIIPMAEDGFFYGGVGVVPGLADGATTQFTLTVWRGSPDLASATESATATWSQATGAWNPNAQPPAAPTGPALQVPANMILTATPVVPEPSTIALGLIGGAALLFFRRK